MHVRALFFLIFLLLNCLTRYIAHYPDDQCATLNITVDNYTNNLILARSLCTISKFRSFSFCFRFFGWRCKHVHESELKYACFNSGISFSYLNPIYKFSEITQSDDKLATLKHYCGRFLYYQDL